MEAARLPRARLEPPAVRAIVRERVDRLLDRAWDVPLTVVVGPAGAGKTTAVSHLVQRSRHPVVWYRAHPVDADEAVFCEHLDQAVAHRTGERGALVGDSPSSPSTSNGPLRDAPLLIVDRRVRRASSARRASGRWPRRSTTCRRRCTS